LFFFLSKTVGHLLLPTNFLITLGLLGAVLLATRYARAGRRLMLLSIVLLAIAGFSPLGNWLLYPLEQRFPPCDVTNGTPDGIIVLGGSIDADLSVAHHGAVVRSAADRILAGAALARRYPDARVIFSGGSAKMISNDAREADYAAALFESLGIDKARLLMERRSRNTQENAEFSKVLAAPKGGERWLLVTSAYHMPRAMAAFRAVDFPVEAYPVDWRTRGWVDLQRGFPTLSEGLRRTDAATREWVGLIVYRLTGVSAQLLPGP
jgi:uncharacterized SAM-binding protein YcdF (DUF218 family)